MMKKINEYNKERKQKEVEMILMGMAYTQKINQIEEKIYEERKRKKEKEEKLKKKKRQKEEIEELKRKFREEILKLLEKHKKENEMEEKKNLGNKRKRNGNDY